MGMLEDVVEALNGGLSGSPEEQITKITSGFGKMVTKLETARQNYQTKITNNKATIVELTAENDALAAGADRCTAIATKLNELIK